MKYSVSNPIYFGYNPPFIGGPEGILSRQVDERIIRNDLLQLLLTSPGERVMRPDFGTGIRRFLFDNITPDNLADLRINIQETIDKYEPRVSTTDIQLNVDENTNLLKIRVFGFFNADRYQVESQARDAGLIIEFGLPLNQLKVNTIGVVQT